MKNRTARITMMKRTAGLILVLEDGGDGEDIDSLWKEAPGYGDEDDDDDDDEGEDKTGGGG